jgi:hypothetical protein
MTKYIIILILLVVSNSAFTQTLKIQNLSVYPAIEVDPTTGNPLDTTVIPYNLEFLINLPANANSVRLLFGTSKDSGNILDNTASIVQQGGQYAINYNGVITTINSPTAIIKANLTRQQEANFEFITLYLIDQQGQETNRLYFVR